MAQATYRVACLALLLILGRRVLQALDGAGLFLEHLDVVAVLPPVSEALNLAEPSAFLDRFEVNRLMSVGKWTSLSTILGFRTFGQQLRRIVQVKPVEGLRFLVRKLIDKANASIRRPAVYPQAGSGNEGRRRRQ